MTRADHGHGPQHPRHREAVEEAMNTAGQAKVDGIRVAVDGIQFKVRTSGFHHHFQ